MQPLSVVKWCLKLPRIRNNHASPRVRIQSVTTQRSTSHTASEYFHKMHPPKLSVSQNSPNVPSDCPSGTVHGRTSLSLVEHSQLQVEIDPPRRNSGLMPAASPAAPTVSDSPPYHGEQYRKVTVSAYRAHNPSLCSNFFASHPDMEKTRQSIMCPNKNQCNPNNRFRRHRCRGFLGTPTHCGQEDMQQVLLLWMRKLPTDRSICDSRKETTSVLQHRFKDLCVNTLNNNGHCCNVETIANRGK